MLFGLVLFIDPRQSKSNFFLLAKLLSVRYAPVSERAKACKEAKGNRKQKTEPENHKQQNPHKKPNTTNTTNPFAAGETCETGET